MENTNIHHYLISEYNRLAFTHSYIFGYVESGMVYAFRVENGTDLLPFITTLDRASSKNGGTYQLKFKPNKAQRATLQTAACEVKAICSEEYLERLYTESRHNRGQLFESLVAAAFNGKLTEKMNAKFTTDGDMEINGKPYQIKYNKATFTDERTIRNLTAA